MALSEAKREGNARHLANLKAGGWKKVTVWVSQKAQGTIHDLQEAHGSLNAGLEAINGKLPGSAD